MHDFIFISSEKCIYHKVSKKSKSKPNHQPVKTKPLHMLHRAFIEKKIFLITVFPVKILQ